MRESVFLSVHNGYQNFSSEEKVRESFDKPLSIIRFQYQRYHYSRFWMNLFTPIFLLIIRSILVSDNYSYRSPILFQQAYLQTTPYIFTIFLPIKSSSAASPKIYRSKDTKLEEMQVKNSLIFFYFSTVPRKKLGKQRARSSMRCSMRLVPSWVWHRACQPANATPRFCLFKYTNRTLSASQYYVDDWPRRTSFATIGSNLSFPARQRGSVATRS